jgi:hypothetical protein
MISRWSQDDQVQSNTPQSNIVTIHQQVATCQNLGNRGQFQLQLSGPQRLRVWIHLDTMKITIQHFPVKKRRLECFESMSFFKISKEAEEFNAKNQCCPAISRNILSSSPISRFFAPLRRCQRSVQVTWTPWPAWPASGERSSSWTVLDAQTGGLALEKSLFFANLMILANIIHDVTFCAWHISKTFK